MEETEIQKFKLEKEIQQKSQRIIDLSAKVSKQPSDSSAQTIYWQNFNELSQTKKELKNITKQYMTLLKAMYKQ